MTALLEVEGLAKSFGGVAAVQGLSFTVPRGEVTGLIGPNGAGKTTIFNLVSGFLPADGGTIRFDGAEVRGMKPHALVRRGMARSFQDIRLFGRLSVQDNVAMAVPGQAGDRLLPALFAPRRVRSQSAAARSRAAELLDFVGMGHKAQAQADDLSYGQQKLVLIARLLALEPSLLLLDEPCSGLDPTMLDRVIKLLAELTRQRRTVVLIEHNMDVVRAVAQRVVFLAEGRALASGPTEAILADAGLTKIYFGM